MRLFDVTHDAPGLLPSVTVGLPCPSSLFATSQLKVDKTKDKEGGVKPMSFQIGPSLEKAEEDDRANGG
jgi:hypothetical protein